MLVKNTLGLIVSESTSMVGALTTHRNIGALHFGGRYRLVDFTLSNMVNSGIFDVGLITQSNYRSLMEHLGSGRHWDLSRKKGGLSILPPFVGESISAFSGESLYLLHSALGFIEKNNAQYVVITNSDIVGVIDYQSLVRAHIEKQADITVCYKQAQDREGFDKNSTTFEIDENERITKTMIGNYNICSLNHYLGICVMERKLLVRLIKETHSSSKNSFVRDIIQQLTGTHSVYGYHQQGYAVRINSLDTYYKASMELLNADIRKQLFRSSPVFTKVQDEVPAKYGIEASAVNSIVADGSIIDGTIENCVIFRGVRIEKGAVVKNSIIMQGTTVRENAKLSHMIVDKNCTISKDRVLAGYTSYPVVIAKDSVV